VFLLKKFVELRLDALYRQQTFRPFSHQNRAGAINFISGAFWPLLLQTRFMCFIGKTISRMQLAREILRPQHAAGITPRRRLSARTLER
jgi:hypothetical protein